MEGRGHNHGPWARQNDQIPPEHQQMVVVVAFHNFGLALRGSALEWLDLGTPSPTNHVLLSSYYSQERLVGETHHRWPGQPPTEAQRKGLWLPVWTDRHHWCNQGLTICIQHLLPLLTSEPAMTFPQADWQYALITDKAPGRANTPRGLKAILTQMHEFANCFCNLLCL